MEFALTRGAKNQLRMNSSRRMSSSTYGFGSLNMAIAAIPCTDGCGDGEDGDGDGDGAMRMGMEMAMAMGDGDGDGTA